MKLKKILAAVAAAAVAVSTMAVNAFAIDKGTYLAEDAGLNTVFLVADDGKPQWAVDNNVDVTTIYGVTFHCTFDAGEVADESAWIGGGIGANSPSTGWKQIEWGRNDKEVVADLENGTITWKTSSPVFKANDKYVQFWLMAWDGTVTVNSADLLDKDGNVIEAAPAPAPAEDETAPADDAAPADDGAADDDATPVEDTADDDDVAADDDDDDVVAPAPVVDEAPAVTTAAPAADTNTAPAATGNAAVASIAVVMAVAGAAAIAAKKRK